MVTIGLLHKQKVDTCETFYGPYSIFQFNIFIILSFYVKGKFFPVYCPLFLSWLYVSYIVFVCLIICLYCCLFVCMYFFWSIYRCFVDSLSVFQLSYVLREYPRNTQRTIPSINLCTFIEVDWKLPICNQ